LFDTALEVVLWVFFWYVGIWNWMDGLLHTFALCSAKPYVNDIMQALLFSVMVSLIEQMLNLPFSIYSTFTIEEKYGFNKTTPGVFICDELKKFVIGIVFMAVAIPLLLWLIAVSGSAVILSLAACSIALVILISLLIPTVIIPMFYTMSDLEEGDLRTAII
jgi:STE24 endopeptidase